MSEGAYAGSTVFLTGAQGFIGSWLAERLLDEGARVVALDHDHEGPSRFRLDGIEERCELVQAELLDWQALERALGEHEPRVVFHLAAQTIVGTANESPLPTLETNVQGSWSVLEACRRHREAGGAIDAVVVASSDKAYGDQEELPLREDSPLRATYPYDVSKACADLIARSYAATFDLPVAVTRLGNVYGPGDFNYSRIVPDTARALIAGERPVIRSDGTPERDYLYVADAIEAYLAVAASLARPEMRGRAWNAAGGEPISALEVVRRLIAASGRDVEPQIVGSGIPPGEIARQYLDPSAIREELGWKPAWNLDRGLADTYAWYERALARA
jgi:CDP-glucose 4,6-dehydratase